MFNIEPQQLALAFSAISILLWLYAVLISGTAVLNQWKWRHFRILFFLSLVMLTASAVVLYAFAHW